MTHHSPFRSTWEVEVPNRGWVKLCYQSGSTRHQPLAEPDPEALKHLRPKPTEDDFVWIPILIKSDPDLVWAITPLSNLDVFVGHFQGVDIGCFPEVEGWLFHQ